MMLMKEQDMINLLKKHLKRSKDQINKTFCSDAEIVKFGENFLAISIDEFSSEDGFQDTESYNLGWNVICATISDLLAVGAEPSFMVNSLTIKKNVSEKWIEDFSKGMQSALDSYNTFMLGGDIGTDDNWRFNGVALGNVKKPITRKISNDFGLILATGSFGKGNCAAAGFNSKFKINNRSKEAKLLSGLNVACIDTSDGLISSLATILEINSNYEIILDLNEILYSENVSDIAKSLSIPEETFLMGSAGEYELLVFSDNNDAKNLIENSDFKVIGSFSRKNNAGLFYKKNKYLINHCPLPDPRKEEKLQIYLDKLICLSKQMFGRY